MPSFTFKHVDSTYYVEYSTRRSVPREPHSFEVWNDDTGERVSNDNDTVLDVAWYMTIDRIEEGWE